MRYLGQWRSLSVNCGSGPGALADAVNLFHEQYEREYAFRQDDAPVEIYQLSLTAIGKTPKPAFHGHDASPKPSPQCTDSRKVYFESTGWIETAVFDRQELPAGTHLVGPTVIYQLDSTTVVPPGATADVDEWLNIRIHLTEA